MKVILASILMISGCNAHGQDQENLEKYWKYRDQLRTRFMKIGIGQGESITVSASRVGYQ